MRLSYKWKVYLAVEPGSLTIHHFKHKKKPVPSQEYASCYPFVWFFRTFNFAIWLWTFRFEFLSEFSIFVLLLFIHYSLCMYCIFYFCDPSTVVLFQQFFAFIYCLDSDLLTFIYRWSYPGFEQKSLFTGDGFSSAQSGTKYCFCLPNLHPGKGEKETWCLPLYLEVRYQICW